VAAGVQLKGLDPKAAIVGGEEWLGGPYPTAAWLTDMIGTLTRLSTGADPLEGVRIRTRPDGQVIAGVFPSNAYDRLLLNGYELDVWMQPGVTRASLRDTVAPFYRQSDPIGALTLVLGAGNVAAIPMLDALYCLFVDGHVVVLKMNPVNEAYGPVFARVLDPLIRDGYLAIVYGGADVGEHLTGSDLVDTVHITGSERTHDTIVFGPGEAGQEAKAAGMPRFVKPIRSELGGASPTIVVPGPWSRADIAYQAQHLATQKLFSAGHTCVASQVLILPQGWDRKDQLLDALRSALAELSLSLFPNAHARGFYQNTLPGDFVIRLQGPYDIALNRQPDGSFGLTADLYEGHVEREVGQNYGRLLQLYGVHKALREARQKGLSVRRRSQADGSIKLTVTGV
jgi:aldehyde dehydrogenase (NAD(P)+)